MGWPIQRPISYLPTKWAKYFNIIFLKIVHFSTNLSSYYQLQTCAAKLAKNLNRAYWELFLCYVKLNYVTNFEPLLQSDQNSWIESYLELCIYHLIFDNLHNFKEFLRSEQNNVTKSCWEHSICSMSSTTILPARNICFEVTKYSKRVFFRTMHLSSDLWSYYQFQANSFRLSMILE